SADQWKLESMGNGFYKIINRENNKALTSTNNALTFSDFTGKENQLWKIDNSYYGLYKISNKQYPLLTLSVNGITAEGSKTEVSNAKTNNFFTWQLQEVCESKVQA